MGINNKLTKILIAGILTIGSINCVDYPYKPIEREIFDDYQIERRREWNGRDMAFKQCDTNQNSMLEDSSEVKCYLSRAKFNYSFGL